MQEIGQSSMDGYSLYSQPFRWNPHPDNYLLPVLGGTGISLSGYPSKAINCLRKFYTLYFQLQYDYVVY